MNYARQESTVTTVKVSKTLLQLTSLCLYVLNRQQLVPECNHCHECKLFFNLIWHNKNEFNFNKIWYVDFHISKGEKRMELDFT